MADHEALDVGDDILVGASALNSGEVGFGEAECGGVPASVGGDDGGSCGGPAGVRDSIKQDDSHLQRDGVEVLDHHGDAGDTGGLIIAEPVSGVVGGESTALAGAVGGDA